MLTVPVQGTTIGAVMKSLYKGLHTSIKSGNRGFNGTKKGDYYFEPTKQKYPFPSKNEVVYDKISGFFDSSIRESLIKQYEHGTLKPYDLYGDHIAFSGLQRKGKYLFMILSS